MKKAIIIGATSGLGREVARRLVLDGYMVGVSGRRLEALEELQQEFGSDKIIISAMDVTSEDSASVLEKMIAEMGSPDLFLYASGVAYSNPDLDDKLDIQVIKTHCEGLSRLMLFFLRYVKNSGNYSASRRAHIAVITSVAATKGIGTAAAYSSTKRMQCNYIAAYSQLSRMQGIPVDFTDIRPGFVNTAILNPEKKYPKLISVPRAADFIMKGLQRRKRVVIFDWRYKLIIFVWRLIPDYIWERLTIIKN